MGWGGGGFYIYEIKFWGFSENIWGGHRPLLVPSLDKTMTKKIHVEMKYHIQNETDTLPIFEVSKYHSSKSYILLSKTKNMARDDLISAFELK